MRNGKLATIIFIRDVNSRGHEVSGYIDYGHRLTTDPNVPLWFERKKRLMPKPSDLSYYNWVTHLSTSNPTPNFQVGGWGMPQRPQSMVSLLATAWSRNKACGGCPSGGGTVSSPLSGVRWLLCHPPGTMAQAPGCCTAPAITEQSHNKGSTQRPFPPPHCPSTPSTSYLHTPAC